ncbi:Uncharacterised protein [Candidatus Bartonella washoeensis]|uniref:Uncharacterized protein n=1 Tax=Candidatus Bartonella washoeensis Sb944nv TaxID=1094563 RepID=J0YUK9_9HYPH|nr:hypothetical protein MCQ_01052 [Bartonella washoeensis Sb944nv]SPU27184.1 Uncharacterised protein [Bartonella washoeensis]
MNAIRFSAFKSSYAASIKIIYSYVTGGIGVWIKVIEKGVNIFLMDRFNARVYATLGVAKAKYKIFF